MNKSISKSNSLNKIKNSCVPIILCLVFLNSCGYKYKSIVNNPTETRPFTNPLFVVPYDERIKSSKKFAEFFKQDLENQLELHGKKATVVTIPTPTGILTLYAEDPVNINIDNILLSNKSDLLITFNKTGRMVATFKYVVSLSYEIVGTDQSNKKECYIGRLKTGATNDTPSMRKSAEKVISGLIESGVI